MPKPDLYLQVHLVERIPWHEALYFVTTTLTTGTLEHAIQSAQLACMT